MTIDYNFFQRKDSNFSEGSFCDIKISLNNYIVSVGGYTYEL